MSTAGPDPVFSLGHRLILVRHGETDWNVEGRLQGQLDIPINARGRDQASAVGRRLKSWLTPDPDRPFVASPLGRTSETMERMRAALGLPPRAYATDARLMEIAFGDWEGLTWPEVKARDPAGYRARRADTWDFVPPGGESYAMLTDRAMGWAVTLDRETIAVAHGGVARVLMHALTGLPPEDACSAAVHQGRALIFEGRRCWWL